METMLSIDLFTKQLETTGMGLEKSSTKPSDTCENEIPKTSSNSLLGLSLSGSTTIPWITLLDVWCRGVLIVSLISFNTRLIADGRSSAIGIGGLISVVWWLNARTANRDDSIWAMIAYATGSACGTALGLWAGSAW
tara:strand:- start:26733 stop:27143 length:411 start_codon:yes stop_codon:yes gene_type:complete